MGLPLGGVGFVPGIQEIFEHPVNEISRRLERAQVLLQGSASVDSSFQPHALVDLSRATFKVSEALSSAPRVPLLPRCE